MANAVQKLEGRLHALKKQIVKLTEANEELGGELGITAGDLADAQNIIRALKNPDMLVAGAPMTLDRVQVMESGDIRVLPPPPAPVIETCVVALEPEKNGTNPEKEAVNAG
jgi:hypothetical protein